MRIELDREKKITLLQALQRGYLEREDIEPWFSVGTMPLEEIEGELDRLTKSTHPDTCNRVKRLGLCECCKR